MFTNLTPEKWSLAGWYEDNKCHFTEEMNLERCHDWRHFFVVNFLPNPRILKKVESLDFVDWHVSINYTIANCRSIINRSFISSKARSNWCNIWRDATYLTARDTRIPVRSEHWIKKNEFVTPSYFSERKLLFIELVRFPGWRLRDIQRWSALIQNTFRSVSALFITWKSLNSADSALNSAENANFQS